MTPIENPVDIFKDLDPTGEFDQLWPAEREVLTMYYESFWKSTRLAIQLPTGSGKSLIGILIAEAWRRKKKHVAILTSTKALAEDMKRKCDALKVASVVISGKTVSLEENRQRIRNIRSYKRTQSIGIFNYWSYMYATDIEDPDVLVIDDADNFESLVFDHYSVKIPRWTDTWRSIVARLAEFKVYQKLDSFLVGNLADDYEVIYFPHSIEMASLVVKAALAKGTSNIDFDLSSNKERMHTYMMFVSNDNILFAPQVCPSSSHQRLQNVERIVFMSATIGSPEMLHKRLGFQETIDMISEKDLAEPIGTMGQRLIFPISGVSPSPSISGPTLNAIERIVNEFGKVLILCVSNKDAGLVRQHFEQSHKSIIQYKRDEDIVAFRAIPEGILLAAGRFFGIDLSMKACQVVIIPRLPYVVGPMDLLASEILEDSRYLDEKVANRLVQGCGRCNRGPRDRAVYFVLDGRLAGDMLGEEKIFSYFPHKMRAEADFGQEFAETGGLESCIAQAKLLLEGKLPRFDEDIDDRMTSESEAVNEEIDTPYIDEIKGWHELSGRRDYVDAAKTFDEAVTKCKSDSLSRYSGWLHYLSAFGYHLASSFYKDPSFEKSSIENLEVAVKKGRNSWFSGLRVVINDLQKGPQDDKLITAIGGEVFGERLIRGWQDFFAANTTKKRTPYKAWENLTQNLLDGTHNQVCDALESCLELIGFEVRSLRDDDGKPDLLAFSTWGTKYVLVVEVKTKDQGAVLGRDDVDQVTGHRAVYQKLYPDHLVFPLVFTNKESQSDTALEKGKHNARIIIAPTFVFLLNKYFELIRLAPKATDPATRFELLTKIPALETLIAVCEPRDKPVVELQELNEIL